MTENSPINIATAFEILLEEIEAEVDIINKLGARAFEREDYENVRKALEQAQRITDFREKVASLQQEWETLIKTYTAEQKQATGVPSEHRNSGRLPKGVRTPEKAYYKPILQALEEFGGSGELQVVLQRVEQLMRGMLKPVDYEPLNADQDTLRWRNTAQWARNTMARKAY